MDEREFQKKQEEEKSNAKYDKVLANELLRMMEVDQISASVPSGKYKELPLEKWKKIKDSIFRTHEKRLQQIFKNIGFAGYDLVGEEGSRNFFLMVQHSDHNPVFKTEC